MATDPLKPDRVRSFICNLLPLLRYVCRLPGLNFVWVRLHGFHAHGVRPVRARIHGRTLWLNPGHPYVFAVAEHPRFNGGLVATAVELHRSLVRPLRMIDVGAGIGDTVVLLDYRCPNAISTYFCIDGDAEFAGYFVLNTAGIAGVSFHLAMLAASETLVPELVRHHPGTASATSDRLTTGTTIDRILTGETARWDLLKVDLDGFDGEALAGARQLLLQSQPAVYFEWHPRLIRNSHNDIFTAFDVLRDAGYTNFLWFHNRGPFSHCRDNPTRDELLRAADALAVDQNRVDSHFDVLALPSHLAHLALSIATRVGS